MEDANILKKLVADLIGGSEEVESSELERLANGMILEKQVKFNHTLEKYLHSMDLDEKTELNSKMARSILVLKAVKHTAKVLQDFINQNK